MDIDAPLADYFAQLPNPAWGQITARQLASHSAGITHYGDNQDVIGRYHTAALQHHYDDPHDALSVFDGSPLLFDPGTKFEYSSLGTVLLGVAMSEASGRSYRQLMHEQVFAPLGMTSTIIAPRVAPEHSELATFYLKRDGGFRPWRPVDLSHRLPGGGFASSPSDLVRLGIAQLDEGFIRRETRDEFWTPQRLSSGLVNPQDYALGWRWREWEIDGHGVVRNANHGGVSRGAMTWLLVFPDHNMAIAFSINTRLDEFHDFGHEIYEALFSAFADN